MAIHLNYKSKFNTSIIYVCLVKFLYILIVYTDHF